MATRIQWKEVMSPIDAMDAEVKRNTGVSIRENIAKRQARNPFANEQLFVRTIDGTLPVKSFRRIH